ncbi:uncharacterized protein LOC114330563 isoform X2 [Diabrotica virgifera virgifera]|uniref:Uncharacterized protein LOC114330563 isoform X2 n=1 Tax=Diabrotica virgifera virgifera TaxID=50390 RepID=A0A6P7FIK4_DIAVI|nr:uncharacterized protein LOC114330563 isoform X2 [Diabrotica virgifera virgifera]
MSSVPAKIVFLLFTIIVLITKIKSQNDVHSKNRDPVYCRRLCSSARFACQPTNCKDGQVEGYKPELCRCCTECYTKLNEGDKCGDNDEAICDQGLTCRNNVCRKEAEPL